MSETGTPKPATTLEGACDLTGHEKVEPGIAVPIRGTTVPPGGGETKMIGLRLAKTPDPVPIRIDIELEAQRERTRKANESL